MITTISQLSYACGAQVAVEAQGATLEAAVLAVLEFSSDRKRMSVLARLPNGNLRLFSKVCSSTIYHTHVHKQVLRSCRVCWAAGCGEPRALTLTVRLASCREQTR